MSRITDEQFELLARIVDAYWTLNALGQKLDLVYISASGGLTFLDHHAMEGRPQIDYPDLEELESHGLVVLKPSRERSGSLYPTAQGKHVVEEQRRIEQIARADNAIGDGSGGSKIAWDATLPVLQAVVELYAQAAAGEHISQMQVNQRLGREDGDSDTSRAFEVLEQGGYVQETASIDGLPGALTVVPTEKALQLLAGWPADGEVALARLVAALQTQIDATSDEEEKGKLKRALDAVQGIGENVAAEVLTKVMMGG
ncbi:MAG TPA: hypothetical protein VF729_00610 [Solirubrobacterales bacterium]